MACAPPARHQKESQRHLCQALYVGNAEAKAAICATASLHLNGEDLARKGERLGLRKSTDVNALPALPGAPVSRHQAGWLCWPLSQL